MWVPRDAGRHLAAVASDPHDAPGCPRRRQGAREGEDDADERRGAVTTRNAAELDCDVAVVGGGIAGSALASVLAGNGLDVMALERQERYTDHVRGENLHPWGVAEAQTLGIADVLMDAGGHLVEETVNYGDGDDPALAEASALRLGELIDGVDGELNLAHPTACEALTTLAAADGATVRRGVSHVEVTPGPRPTVSYRYAGHPQQLACRLVVGADGRSSRVRRQAGIHLQHASATHLVAGLLVDGLDHDPRRNVVGIGEDVWMVTFPQGGGRARIYLCPSTENPQRFAGPRGAERFLQAAALDAVPEGRAWAEAVPAGPCRTFPADDSWTDRPFAEGVVLIGDAAGYNNPLIGQGLAMALRDVRALSEALLAAPTWSDGIFVDYGKQRAERMRRVRFLAQLHASVWIAFGPAGRALRRRVAQQWQADPSLLGAVRGVFTGPDRLDPRVSTDSFRRHYLGLSDDIVSCRSPERTAG